MTRLPIARIARVAALAGLTAALSVLTSGCSDLGYLTQSVRGHLQLLDAARPVPEVLADPATAPALKDRLELAQRMRDFAVAELHLPDNASYRRYADLRRPAAVWNVVAAPELSLTLQTWCFPVVGCVAYRGYYQRDEAEAYAATLRARGLDVGVLPVPAYSTLGKIPGDHFADPLLNTFVNQPESELARSIFHELTHQVAFAPGDTVFNESFATTVERIGSARWLAAHGSQAARDEAARIERRREDFRTLTRIAREQLAQIYAGTAANDERRQGKAEKIATLQAAHEALKAGAWQGFGGYDAWFSGVNNATLGMVAAYDTLVPRFEQLLAAQDNDLTRFYAEVQRLAALPRDERWRQLGAAPPP